MSVSTTPRIDPIRVARDNWIAAGWHDSADGMALVTSIMRLQQVMLAAADATLRPHGLTFSRFEVLMLLQFSRTGGLPVGRIGERLQVHAASVTNAVDRLESAGLAERTRSESDGRVVIASITPAGRDVVGRAARDLNEAVFRAVPLSQRAEAEAFDLLSAWRRGLGDFDVA